MSLKFPSLELARVIEFELELFLGLEKAFESNKLESSLQLFLGLANSSSLRKS